MWWSDSTISLLYCWCLVKLLPFRRTFCLHHTTVHQFTVSLHSEPHTPGACVFRCIRPPTLLAEWPGSFTCCCSNRRVERMPKSVSAESWPWRTKFSRRSCRDSNPRPFGHESCALTTELSPLPVLHIIIYVAACSYARQGWLRSVEP